MDRGELETEIESVRNMLAALGPRPRREQLRRAILRLTQRPRTPTQLARLLGRPVPKLVERYLTPMVRDGLLVRRHPENPNHPDQAIAPHDSSRSSGRQRRTTMLGKHTERAFEDAINEIRARRYTSAPPAA